MFAYFKEVCADCEASGETGDALLAKNRWLGELDSIAMSLSNTLGDRRIELEDGHKRCATLFFSQVGTHSPKERSVIRLAGTSPSPNP